MANVMLPDLRKHPRSPIGQVTSPLRPALKRGGSSASSTVRFAEEAATATPLTLTLPVRRPAFARQETGASVKTIDSTLPASYPPAQMQPAPARATEQPRGHIFGLRTAYKPLWLLGAGTLGNVLYGTGTIAIERGIWPRAAWAVPPPGAAANPLTPLFGEVRYSLGLGIASTVGGVGLAGGAAALFYQDARRLARRQNAANPNYLRPTLYFAAHITAILLSAGGKFMSEALLDTVPADYRWVSALPLMTGQAVFAVTQANSFSSCEILNRRLPIKHRSAVGFGARAGVSMFTVWAAMMSVPRFSSYGREAMRLSAQASLTLSYSLPLTTARLGRHQGVDFTSHQPEPNWYALQVLMTYITGRVLAGFGPDMLQAAQDAADKNEGLLFGGAAALTAGTGACFAALMLLRQDVAAYSPRQANMLFAGAAFALLSILAYVGLANYAGRTRQPELVWAALVPGVIGAGLRLAILPSMFSFAELRHGDLPLPQRLYWTEASRAIAGVCFGAWGVMSGQPGVNVYLREAVAVAAGSFATLGMALPTTTSKRALPQYAWPLSPGATPPASHDGVNYFASAFQNQTANDNAV